MPGKSWGPFSGRQLTTIIVSLIIGVVLLPSAVWAVDSFTNVAIQDPVSGYKVGVTSSRKALVSDGSGSMTVDGTVSAREMPYNLLQHWAGFPTSTSGCTPIATPDAGKALVIKTLHIDTWENPSPGSLEYLTFTYGPASDPCVNLLDDINPSGIGQDALDFSAGVALPAGNVLAAFVTGSLKTEVYAFGFQITGSTAPAAGVAATSDSPLPGRLKK